MNRYVLPMLISLVALGVAASLAATTSPSTESPLAGKTVLVSQPGVIHSIHENARFESVGQADFIVVPMQPRETLRYDNWIPLKDVTLLQVFHTKADAKEYKEYLDAVELTRQRNIEQRNIKLMPDAE